MTFFVYGNLNSKDWSTVKYIGAASYLGRPLAHEKESRNLKNRTRKHNSIRKLIREGHHVGWKILAACDSWKETLATERILILEHKAKFGKRPDWNLTDGGEGVLNPSSKSRKRRSDANRSAHADPEVKKRHRAGVKVAMNVPGVQEKLHTPEINARRSTSGVIAQNRSEVKSVVSASSKAVWARPGEKERRSILCKQAAARPEVKANQSAASKHMWEARRAAGFTWPSEWAVKTQKVSPETCEKRRLAQTGKRASLETRARMAESQKARRTSEVISKMGDLRRPRQRDCKFEPPYPGEQTVVCALSDPDRIVHGMMGRCGKTWPHPVAECFEFNMTDRDHYVEEHRWENRP